MTNSIHLLSLFPFECSTIAKIIKTNSMNKISSNTSNNPPISMYNRNDNKHGQNCFVAVRFCTIWYQWCVFYIDRNILICLISNRYRLLSHTLDNPLQFTSAILYMCLSYHVNSGQQQYTLFFNSIRSNINRTKSQANKQKTVSKRNIWVNLLSYTCNMQSHSMQDAIETYELGSRDIA